MADIASPQFQFRGVARYRSLRDGTILSIDEGSDPELFLAKLLREAHRHSLGLRHPASFRIEYQGSGDSLLIAFPEESFLIVNRGVSLGASPGIITHYLQGFCVLRLALLGAVNLWLDGEPQALEEQSCTFLYAGRGLRWGFELPRDTTHRSVTMLFKASLIEEHVDGTSLDTLNLASLREHAGAPLFFDITPSQEAMQIGVRILGIDENAATVRLLSRGLMLELIATILDQLRPSRATEGHSRRLRPREIEALMAARSHVDSVVSERHTLASLSRHVGLNRRALTEGFRALFGVTVGEYLTAHRMKVASELLEQGVPVARVAEQVGYQDRTSFSRAFHRFTGFQPSAGRPQGEGSHDE